MKSPSPAITAALSFAWPGLGHAYLGRRRTALVFALPVLLATVAIVIGAWSGLEKFAVFLVTPSGALTVLSLVVLTGIWRLIALSDSAALATRMSDGRRAGATAFAAALGVSIVVMHLGAAAVTFAVYDASTRIFVGVGPDDDPSPNLSSPSGPTPTPSDDFVATPVATPETAESRINVLLTGVDSADGRNHSLTDTLLVVSLDPRDGSAVMISLPRDIARFELSTGKVYMGKINSLMSWARARPKEFPEGPLPTLIREVGHIVGVPIHYYAAIDIDGFRRMIDEVGGVTVVNERAINDPTYSWLDGRRGFSLKAGTVTLDGDQALAFVRSRKGAGDNDFTRAARQQQLLVALRAKLTTPEMLARLPGLLDAAADTVRTNLPQDRLMEFVDLARGIEGESIKRYVLGPPYSVHPPTASTGGIYILKLDEARIAALSVELFGDESRYATP
jgi:polyisoprenyl-teichoic acid--peptidoglycan teichoic acid transferase